MFVAKFDKKKLQITMTGHKKLGSCQVTNLPDDVGEALPKRFRDVRDAVLLTERSHEWRRLAQVVPRHRRE